MELGTVRDPRLDPYRDRAARLSQDGAEVGYLLVETQEAQLKGGGFGWWSRWDPPEEMVVLAVLVGDDIVEGQTYVREELSVLVDDWSRDRFETVQDVYDVEWLDEAESGRVHREVFGHHH